MFKQYPVFDSHFHIIDRKHPLIPNNGYIPEEFLCNEYLSRLESYSLCGGAIVSGSFQAFDQGYLIEALKKLGASFVGVTQLPFTVTDQEIISLNQIGVRAVRFNLKRGGSEDIAHLSTMASRIFEIAGWHVELYVDSNDLAELHGKLIKLPAVSIDHLGLSQSGFKHLIKLAEKGAWVKATGFGRVDFEVKHALKELYSANPSSLIFGSDLPSTRAPRPYADIDFIHVIDALGSEAAQNVFSKNAIKLYKPRIS
jgi:predicted TIM-barrel fold metal-dependent hydrolase